MSLNLVARPRRCVPPFQGPNPVMSDTSHLYTAANFRATIRKYCEDLGFTISREVEDAFSLRFDCGDCGIPVIVFVVRQDEDIKFFSPSNYHFDSEDEVPGDLCKELLKENAMPLFGAWSLERMGEKLNYGITGRIPLCNLTSEDFAVAANSLAARCDAVNLMKSTDGTMLFSAENFEDSMVEFCEPDWELEKDDDSHATLHFKRGRMPFGLILEDDVQIGVSRVTHHLYFMAMTQLRVSTEDEFPDAVSTAILKKSDDLLPGCVWSIQGNESVSAFCFSYVCDLKLLNKELFDHMMEYIVTQCDALNVIAAEAAE